MMSGYIGWLAPYMWNLEVTSSIPWEPNFLNEPSNLLGLLEGATWQHVIGTPHHSSMLIMNGCNIVCWLDAMPPIYWMPHHLLTSFHIVCLFYMSYLALATFPCHISYTGCHISCMNCHMSYSALTMYPHYVYYKAYHMSPLSIFFFFHENFKTW